MRLRLIMDIKVIVLVCVLFACVSGEDFDELQMEEVVGTYTYGYFKNRNETVKSLDGLNGTIVFKDDLLWFTCDSIHPINVIFPPFKDKVYPKKIAIRYCTLPLTPLADALEELNINVPTIEFLQYAFLHITNPLPKGNYMQGLNLKTLFIDTLFSVNIFGKNPDFLKPLSNLTTLMVWGTTVPKLPENIHLEVLSLRHEGTADNFTNCKNMRVLSIHNVAAFLVPRYWPEECKNLTHIRLKGLTTVASHQVMGSDVALSSVNLQTLYMQYCNLTNPPYTMLNTAKNLRHLNFTGNRISDDALIRIPFLQNLTNFDLSRNFLTGVKLFELAKHTPKLRYYNLNHNWMFLQSVCNQDELKEFSSNLKSLKWLSMLDVPIRPDCFQNIHFSSLQYLNLASLEKSSNKSDSFNLRLLPTTDAKVLEVDLRGRHIKRIQFNSDDYLALHDRDFHHLWGSSKTHDRRRRPKLIVHLDKAEYDCRNHWFCLALREFPDLITSTNLNCSNTKEKLLNENCKVDFDSGCSIRHDGEPIGDGMAVTCDDMGFINLDKLSQIYNITKLNLYNNRIQSIENVTLPQSVQWIDLRGNEITNLDDASVNKLFNNPNRTILLSNNSLICDCELIENIRNFTNQIEDLDLIQCADTEKTLKTVLQEKKCPETSYSSYFIATACVIFTIKIIFLSWWYNGIIRRFFTSHGWCLCCCKPEVDDAVAWESVEAKKTLSQQDLVET